MMKPYWPRMLQLQPAHLHARDAYVEELLTARTSRCVPHAYGILELEVDTAAGAEGDVVVRRLDAIFPSGAVARVAMPAPLRRKVAGAGDASLDVFLGLPRALLRAPNVSLEGGPVRSTRFVAPARKDSSDLPGMRANPEILFEGESLEGFEVLRLGRVARFGKSVRFEPGALPTVLRVAASAGLREGLREVVQACERRREELVRYRADHPLKLGAVVPMELPALQLSVILQRYLPLLSDCAARRSAHPHALYGTLVAMHGALSAFGSPEIAPPYEHDDQGRVPWLFERIARLAHEAARDATTVLPFQRTGETTFRLAFKRGDLAGKRPMLVLRGADEAFLRDRVPSLLKMASPAAIKSILHSALRGAAVAVEFDPPPVIPRQEDVVAYRIDLRDRHWLDIEDRMEVQLQMAGAPPTLEAFLYGVERLV
ncbi:MAG TPA: type VI secretion system baseplate subunit TssK [Polyangiaceae bacterium]|jgi:type VI secretion system protein ImpJ